MIAEAIDTATRIGWAIAAWIVLTSAAATLALYTLAVTAWTVGRGIWRVGAWAWRAVRKPQAPATAPQGAPCGSRDANTPQRPAQRRTAPSWARADHDHDHQEAA